MCGVVVVVMCGGGAFSMSPVAAFIRSGLSFRFKPASLPVLCCWVSSPLDLCVAVFFLVRLFGGVVM